MSHTLVHCTPLALRHTTHSGILCTSASFPSHWSVSQCHYKEVQRGRTCCLLMSPYSVRGLPILPGVPLTPMTPPPSPFPCPFPLPPAPHSQKPPSLQARSWESEYPLPPLPLLSLFSPPPRPPPCHGLPARGGAPPRRHTRGKCMAGAPWFPGPEGPLRWMHSEDPGPAGARHCKREGGAFVSCRRGWGCKAPPSPWASQRRAPESCCSPASLGGDCQAGALPLTAGGIRLTAQCSHSWSCSL